MSWNVKIGAGSDLLNVGGAFPGRRGRKREEREEKEAEPAKMQAEVEGQETVPVMAPSDGVGISEMTHQMLSSYRQLTG